MKLALCQLNFTVGDLKGNASKIIETIRQLKSSKCELAVFSELAVCGYPPLDLLEKDSFVSDCIKQVECIAKECTGIVSVVGSPSFNKENNGKRLHNSAFVLGEGRILQSIHKTLLPDYDVFDEYRFFEPATEWKTFELKGHRIAITICEDIWEEQPWSPQKKLYNKLPLEKLCVQDSNIIINISASPFSYTQHKYRLKTIENVTKKYHCPVFYVNQTGANTDLVFDGGSLAVNSEGKTVIQAPFFSEAIIETDIENFNKPLKESAPTNETELIHDAIVTGIRDYFAKSGFNKAVLGLSGGIDSALVAALACRALGAYNVTGLLMPSKFSSQHSVDDAVKLAENLGMSYKKLPISEIFDAFEHTLIDSFRNTPFGIAEENIQARIRGSLLMAWSNKFGCILLNTSNKSEVAVGYGTLYGDMCGAISVIGDVYKTQVYKLASFINSEKEIIPINTITKAPSAELREGQKDSDSLPEYSILDAILFSYIEENKTAEEIIRDGFDENTVKRTLRLVNINEYKRYQAPPVIRISTKAFGPGRKMPLVGKI